MYGIANSVYMNNFSLQMRETNFIVQNVRDCSLVVIDELGRGTSREEGVGICYAICEHLLQTKVGYIPFCVHVHVLMCVSEHVVSILKRFMYCTFYMYVLL